MTTANRPCIVDEKQLGYFHEWERKSNPVEPSMMRGGAPGGQLSYTLGIVELDDGKVIECFPYKIRFLDIVHTDKPSGLPKIEINGSSVQLTSREEACNAFEQSLAAVRWFGGDEL